MKTLENLLCFVCLVICVVSLCGLPLVGVWLSAASPWEWLHGRDRGFPIAISVIIAMAVCCVIGISALVTMEDNAKQKDNNTTKGEK